MPNSNVKPPKPLKPIATKPASEVGSKRMYTNKGVAQDEGIQGPKRDEEHDELVEEHERLVHVLKTPSHKDDKEEAKKQAKELKNLKAGKEYKPVNKSLKKVEDITKALKAAAAASLGRRAQAEASGASKEFQGETVEVRDIGIGYSRPLHEPPAVPARRVETPNPVPARKCGDHVYKTHETGPQEAKPIRER